MPYLNIETNEYPRHDGDLELLGWTPGESLPEHWVEVVESPMPTPGENQVIFEIEPAQVDGIWTMQWETRPMTQSELEEIARGTIRLKVLRGETLTIEEAELLTR